ncbi:MAG TPA: polyphosphate kinase 2 family protein [Phycisphaerae bacterium]|nr:polyphosphate kinase 2 family protein [Phycisphaerae bacterium]
MDYTREFIVKPGSKVRLSDKEADFAGPYRSKAEARTDTAGNVRELAELQYRLYAEGKRAVLIVLQGMDAAGKDGTIRHVMGPMNPQSCKVTSFKVPTAEELAHDFLWRVHKAVPAAGEIGIFNRSHYEDVLVVRVHGLVARKAWSRRYGQINDFERMLAANGVHVLKFFLHVSRKEQLDRLKRRLADPSRQWKANPDDFEERKYWDDYRKAYEDALARCSRPWAPWYVIPADRKWFRNLAVSHILVETLQKLDMQYPKPAFDLAAIKPE